MSWTLLDAKDTKVNQTNYQQILMVDTLPGDKQRRKQRCWWLSTKEKKKNLKLDLEWLGKKPWGILPPHLIKDC